MPCHPLMCRRAVDCRDLHCPGHPAGDAAQLDERDRQALAHDAAMNHPLYAPLRETPLPITLECDEPPEPAPQLTRFDRAAVIAFVSLVIVYALAHLLEII
jgi:hypothetical protein